MSTKTAITGLLFYQVLLFSTRPEVTVIVSLLAKGIEIKYLLGISTTVGA
jgi:hypothetical protein